MNADDQVTDPVCGMVIARADAVGTRDHAGETYYFCSDECIVKFDAEPAPFAASLRTIDGRGAAGDA